MSIVIPRAVWQPRYSDGATDSQGRPIIIGTSEWEAAGRELWLHHSTTNPPGPDATLEQDCAHMREFEAIGQARFGQGISYTWVVMPSRRVFAGHSIDRRGAHTYQRNDRSRAICLAGNFDGAALPDRMARSVALLLAELAAELDGGHRDVYATKCPGDHAYARISEMNRLSVAHRRGELDLNVLEDGMALTKDDGNTLWKAVNPVTGVPETHPVAQWMAFATFYSLYGRQEIAAARQEVVALKGLISGLTELVKQSLADDQDIDLAAIEAAAERGAREGTAGALTALPVEVDINLAGDRDNTEENR